MADPTTTNILLSVPTRGSDPGTWDTPINGNSNGIDGFIGGVQTISVTNSPITLTAPTGTPTPTSGPTQAQNAVIRFTGALSGSVQVTLPLPGYMVVENLTTGAFVLSFRAVGSGEIIAIEQSSIQRIYNDGTNVRFVNLPTVGTYLDICDATVPAWITSCSKPPYLLCNGGTFSAVTYPYLNTKLGGTTLPDFRGVSPAFLNQGTSRITTAGSGIDGDTRFSFGSTQSAAILQGNLPAATLATTITDPGHAHANTITATTFGISGSPGVTLYGTGIGGGAPSTLIVSSVTGITASTALGGSGTAFNRMGPTTIAGIRLIRAA